MYVVNVHAFFIDSLILPTSRWNFFSETDPTKYVINAPPFPLLSSSFNGCCVPISVEMSSELSYRIQNFASSHHE